MNVFGNMDYKSGNLQSFRIKRVEVIIFLRWEEKYHNKTNFLSGDEGAGVARSRWIFSS